jgi:hypothetical protein
MAHMFLPVPPPLLTGTGPHVGCWARWTSCILLPARCLLWPFCLLAQVTFRHTVRRRRCLKAFLAGNDLARVLNWGGGYSLLSGTLQDIVTLVHEAIVSPLDRWKLQITPNDGIAL